ncbi:hypothetical protein N752_12380 [Desulforamulus aquiferis]|nr:hypothetical protein N752_12380 [Desulforamulus aquiferis]
MKIAIENLNENELKPIYSDASQLGFGRIFTDRMFTMRYNTTGWADAKIEKYKNFSFDPSACVFHYSQEIFEGMKRTPVKTVGFCFLDLNKMLEG